MNEYLIQETTLSSLADEIRVLSGSEESMSPAEMTANVQSANEDIATEADLIARISSALEGKASGGSSDSSDSYDCEVTYNLIRSVTYAYDGQTADGVATYGIIAPFNMNSTVYLKKGSMFHAFNRATGFSSVTTSGDIELLQNNTVIFHVDLQFVTLCNIQGAPQFDRQHDSAQINHFTNNTR